jgi:UDP-N-acetylmuramoyl-L-alanyl-D-glutamate--2,6-diaminopimelate ligase
MQALGMLGKKAGFIGTLGVFLYDGKIKKLEESELTTPDTISFYYYLALLKSRGVEVACFEASSIGLVGGRIKGVEVDVACITNFTQDHLDFHKTMESYFEAKSLLFLNHLKKNGRAIAGSSVFEKMKGIFPAITSLQALEDEKITPEGSEFKFEGEKFILNLAGRFQLENIGFVIEICKFFGFSLKQISEISPKLLAPKGRLECVHKKPYIFVDYAHTPDSLLKAITTLKEGLVGKIIVVFGCGGNRDASKRPIMGKLACENADFSIITDDNPRTESPEEIRRQIISGFLTNNFIEIGDRSEAIKKAVEIAKPDDVILIAGKGHENYQIIGETKYNFDDAKCVKLLFQK